MVNIVDSEYKLNRIQTHLVADYWDLVNPYIKDALEYEDVAITPWDVFLDVKEGRKQLWIITKGQEIYSVIVTHIEEIYKKKKLIFRYCAGHDIKEWFYMITKFFDYAKKNECVGILVYGRRGWQKLLATSGFQEKATIFSLEF
jgi:hypothetical protein